MATLQGYLIMHRSHKQNAIDAIDLFLNTKNPHSEAKAISNVGYHE